MIANSNNENWMSQLQYSKDISDERWQNYCQAFDPEDYWYIACVPELLEVIPTAEVMIFVDDPDPLYKGKKLPILKKINGITFNKKPKRKLNIWKFIMPDILVDNPGIFIIIFRISYKICKFPFVILEMIMTLIFGIRFYDTKEEKKALDFLEFNPVRPLPPESEFFQYTWLLFGYYYFNTFEKIMFQVIADKENLYNRIKDMYANIGVIAALVAGIAIGAFLSNIQYNYWQNDSLYISFGFGTACAFASTGSLMSIIFSTFYYIVLLATPHETAENFMFSVFEMLGVPMFCLILSVIFLIFALVLATFPIYNLGVLISIYLVAMPALSLISIIISKILTMAIVVVLDELLELKVMMMKNKKFERTQATDNVVENISSLLRCNDEHVILTINK